MKKINKRMSIIALLMVLVFGLSITAFAASAKINKTSTTVYVNQTVTLSISSAKSVKWSTSNKKVASITKKGAKAIVKGVKAGKATVSAKVGKKTFKCKVTVKNPEISKKAITLERGSTHNLKLLGTSIKSVSSSNKSVATVNKKGVVTAKKVGKATITLNGKNKKAYKCKVTVVNPTTAAPTQPDKPSEPAAPSTPSAPATVSVNGITVSGAYSDMMLGTNQTLGVVVSPANATNKAVTWSSSNSSVATVDGNGNVNAVAIGTCTITASAQDGSGVSGSFDIKVSPIMVSSISINSEDFELTKGESKALAATVSPANATNKAVTWSSDDEDIATVDNEGNVVAVSIGTCTIKVKAQDGSGVETSVDVTVTPILVNQINVSQATAELWPDETITLSAEVLPENADNKGFIWESSDASIATVDENGLVTAVSEGTVEISAVADDASGVSGVCLVTVKSDSVIVATSQKLQEAAAIQKIKKIILSSNTTGRIVIPEEDFSDKELQVIVPEGEVENNAKWGNVRILAIKPHTYIENAQDNSIHFEAPSGTIEIGQNAKAQIFVEDVNQDVEQGGEQEEPRKLTVIDNSMSNLVSGIDVASELNLVITGDNSNQIQLTAQEGSEGSVIETTKKVDMTANAKVELILEEGAEDSAIVVDDEENIPNIKGLGMVPVTNTTTGVETMHVAESIDNETTGNITIKGTISVNLASIYLMPYDSTINVENAEERIAELEADAISDDNKYEIADKAIGNYTLVAVADDYVPAVTTVIITSSSATSAEYRIPAITMIRRDYIVEEENNCSISGSIIDSVTGNAIEFDIILNLRSGLNNVSGEVIETVTSSNGHYAFEGLAPGYYTVQAQSASVDNPITSSSVNVTVLSGNFNYNITVTKTLELGQVQFVLHWNQNGVKPNVPRDLDSHLVGPAPDGTKFHTWYSDKTYYYNDERYADLDVDDTTYEGPETTTIYHNVDGIYSFYVYDFTNQDREYCTYMSDSSDAHVEIKSNRSVIDDVTIPTGQKGNLWHVADYDSHTGRFTIVNEVLWWPSDGSSTIGMTEEDVIRNRLARNRATLNELYNILYDNEYKTAVADIIARADAVESNTELATLKALNEEMTQCINDIQNAFYISNVSGDNVRSYDVYTSSISIYCTTTEAGEFTINARNESGQNVSVVFEEGQREDEPSFIGTAVITNTVSGVARQYAVYYQFDSSYLFEISEVKGSGIFSYYNYSGSIEIYTVSGSIPEDFDIVPAVEGTTYEITTDEYGYPVVKMQNGDYTNTKRIYCYRTTSPFRINGIYGNRLNNYNYSRYDEYGEIRIEGFNVSLADLDIRLDYSNATGALSFENLPENCDGIFAVTYGGYTYNYYIYYTDYSQESTELQLGEEVTGESGTTAWYRFTPEESFEYALSVSNSYDYYIELYNENGNYITEISDKAISRTLEAEKTYYYRVITYEDDSSYSYAVKIEKNTNPQTSSRFNINISTSSGIRTYEIEKGEEFGTVTLKGIGQHEIEYYVYDRESNTLTVTTEDLPEGAIGKVEVTVYDVTYPYYIYYVDEAEGCTELMLGEEVTGESGTTVWYRFTPEESFEYVLSVSNSYDYYIELYNENGNYITGISNGAISRTLEAEKTYYYRVRTYGYDSSYSYTVKLEKNTNPQTNSRFNINISTSSGIRTYEIEKGEEFGTVTLKGVSQHEIEYYVYDNNYANSLEVSTENLPEGAIGKVEVTVYDITYPYYIYYVDEAEGCTELQLGEEVTGRSGTTVWYCFTPEESFEYVLSVSNSYDYYIELYNENGNYITDIGNKAISRNLEAEKTYYYRVRAYEDDDSYLYTVKIERNTNPQTSSAFNISFSCNSGSYLKYVINKGEEFGKVNIDGFNPEGFEYSIYDKDGYNLDISTQELPEGAIGKVEVIVYDITYPYYIYYNDITEIAEDIESGQTKTVNIDEKGKSVYYRFTPEESGSYRIYSTGNYDTYVTVYNENGNYISYNDDGGSNNNFELQYELEAGKTYYYAARMYSSSNTGSFNAVFEAVE